MKDGPRSFLQHIEILFDAGAIGEQTDRQLLDRFTAGDRASAELAFTVLVKRHGPTVYRACRAILHDPYAAEDAFQATFLVLARKARGLWVRDSLGPWLLAVAGRVASCARTDAARRRALDRQAAELTASAPDDPGWDDRDAVLHEEVGRLPGKYRSAVVLCDLEGLTQEEAARQLGWPAGTVRSRLARGRQRLRDRLIRRGIAPAVILAGGSPMNEITPGSLVEATIQAALQLGSGRTAIGVTASVITLAEGALRIMYWSKLKTTAAIGMAGALLTGTGMVGYRAMGRVQTPATGSGGPPKQPASSAGSTGAPALAGAEPPGLVEIGRARLRVAMKLQERTFQLWNKGEISLADYLAVEKRYVEMRLEFLKWDSDRIRFLEEELGTLKRLEERLRESHRAGLIRESDVDQAELARLDVEYALAKLKAKADAAR